MLKTFSPGGAGVQVLLVAKDAPLTVAKLVAILKQKQLFLKGLAKKQAAECTRLLA